MKACVCISICKRSQAQEMSTVDSAQRALLQMQGQHAAEKAAQDQGDPHSYDGGPKATAGGDREKYGPGPQLVDVKPRAAGGSETEEHVNAASCHNNADRSSKGTWHDHQRPA